MESDNKTITIEREDGTKEDDTISADGKSQLERIRSLHGVILTKKPLTREEYDQRVPQPSTDKKNQR
jgi:hypothetical protein